MLVIVILSLFATFQTVFTSSELSKAISDRQFNNVESLIKKRGIKPTVDDVLAMFLYGTRQISKFVLDNGGCEMLKELSAKYYSTPVALALFYSNYEVAELLIDEREEYGVQLDEIDPHGNTALHAAAVCQDGRMVKYLLWETIDSEKEMEKKTEKDNHHFGNLANWLRGKMGRQKKTASGTKDRNAMPDDINPKEWDPELENEKAKQTRIIPEIAKSIMLKNKDERSAWMNAIGIAFPTTTSFVPWLKGKGRMKWLLAFWPKGKMGRKKEIASGTKETVVDDISSKDWDPELENEMVTNKMRIRPEVAKNITLKNKGNRSPLMNAMCATNVEGARYLLLAGADVKELETPQASDNSFLCKVMDDIDFCKEVIKKELARD